MRRASWVLTAASACLLALPTSAYAATGIESVTPALRLGAGLAGLLVAVWLLLEALRVRRALAGSAVATRITFVILATLCLAASAVVFWLENFVDVTQRGLVIFAAQLLIVAAMALLGAYFYGVRTALQDYINVMSGGEQPSATRSSAEPVGSSSAEAEAAEGPASEPGAAV